VTLDPSEVGGGSDPRAIEETARSEGRNVPGTPADSAIAWPRKVIDVIRRWLPNGHLVAQTKPVAFVLVPSIRASQGTPLELLDLPLGRSLEPGSIYLCDEGMRRALLPRDPAATVEQWAADLRSVGGGHLPTVVYSPADGLLVWYSKGLDGPDRLEQEVEIGVGRPVTEAELMAQLDRLHVKRWVSPSLAGVWDNSDKWVPVQNAERAFQDQVSLWCDAVFERHNVTTEVGGPGGRCDVFLYPHVASAVGSGVIEMKVLRAFHFPESGGSPTAVPARENVAAIRKGIRQAFVYGRRSGCDVSLLCMCDMRKVDDDAIVAPFLFAADKFKVAMCRYFVFASDEAYRVALTKAVLPE